MSREVSFFAPGIPAPKGSMRAFRHRSTGRIVTTHDSRRTAPWCEAVAWFARAALGGASFGAAPVMVGLEFVVPRPASHFGTGRNRHALRSDSPAWPSRRGLDIDKAARAILDALTGVCWTDDSQVVRLHAAKHWQDPSDWRAEPGCRVRIVELHADSERASQPTSTGTRQEKLR